MFNNARTSARTLLIATTTAGFVALGSGFASADTLDAIAAPDLAGGIGAPDLAVPDVTDGLTAPGAALPEIAAPDANDVVDTAQNQVDSVDVTVPRVNVPEVSTDEYVAAAQGVSFPVLYAATVARGDVEGVAFEVVSVAGQALNGVDADLEVVDTLPGAADLADNAQLPDVADVPEVADAADLPDVADVDTDVLPGAPAVEDVEDTVGGAVDPAGLTDTVTDLDSVDTDIVDTEALTGDLAGGLL